MKAFLFITLTWLLLSIVTSTAAVKSQQTSTEIETSLPGTQKSEKTLLDMFNTGGLLMYPLLLCSIGTIAVATYCFLQINARKMMPKANSDSITTLIKQQNINHAYEHCTSNPNVFTNTLAAGLLKVDFNRDLANKTSVEQAAAETLLNEETKLMQWINYLNVFATIGPMLGLLGTVTGMITSFDQLAAGKSEPQDLAGGIGEAMITTASGLIVGIPAMFFYFYFRSVLTMTISNIQKHITLMIDLLSGEIKVENGNKISEQN